MTSGYSGADGEIWREYEQICRRGISTVCALLLSSASGYTMSINEFFISLPNPTPVDPLSLWSSD